MQHVTSLATAPDRLDGLVRRGRPAQRWRKAWQGSLRFRLLALGLMPLLVAFPLLIGVLAAIADMSAGSLLESNLRSNLTGVRSYLEQLRTDTGVRVAQLVKTERLTDAVEKGRDPQALNQVLRAAAETSGLDFLVIATADGRILGSSAYVPAGARLPTSSTIQQARNGVAASAYERFDAEQLAAFSSALPAQARVERVPLPAAGPVAETRGLMIHAAAHLPLSVSMPDAVLVGGILLNKNHALIEHLREVVYPVGSLPGDAEGLTGIYLDTTMIAASHQRLQGPALLGTAAADDVAERVVGQRRSWIGRRDIDGVSHLLGVEPLFNGEGQLIGMLSAGFPDGPYRRMTWLLLGTTAALLAATMLAISVLFLRTGRELTSRLSRISATMAAVRAGDREARVGKPLRHDELGRLSRHFDVLLQTIAEQDAAQAQAQQAIADEASRRRALFEHERDGVVILNADGTVFEANPKSAQMLGVTVADLLGRHASSWDGHFARAEFDALLADIGAEGRFFETTHRRRDGSTYDAEVSLSRAQWGERSFVFLLQRDISRRKAVDAELGRYRRELEHLVDLRTKELNDRNEQLDAVFALSPDGFVAFDAERRVRAVNDAFLRMTALTADGLIGIDEAQFTQLLRRRTQGPAAFPGIEALHAAGRASGAEDSPSAAARATDRVLFHLPGPPARVLEVGLRESAAANVSQVLYFRDVTHETEVDRMKSEFLTTAAHELRTPMTSIFGFVNLLRRHDDMPAIKRNDILDTVSRQSELMIAIVNQLLDLARIEARRGSDFVIERLSLADLVRSTVADFQPPAGREPPTIAPFADTLTVEADAQKLQQALLNIVSNAYKYSPQGGPVAIGFHVDEPGGMRRLGVSVRDRGIGMTPSQLAHVCERFYRADASGNIPGTGLGMSIVKEIAELHGGRIEIASTFGEGTTMTLWLPAA